MLMETETEQFLFPFLFVGKLRNLPKVHPLLHLFYCNEEILYLEQEA